MDALIRHQKSVPCTHETTLVISNLSGVGGLEKANIHGIKSEIIEVDPSITSANARREEHENRIMGVLEENSIEAVILSGYMRILSPFFVRAWEGRLLNIHPSLLPKFPGAHAHQDVLSSQETESGCTVHFVDSGMDTGAIIEQSTVSVFPDDTVESLQERVKIVEHKLYPKVIDDFSKGKIRLINGEIISLENHVDN